MRFRFCGFDMTLEESVDRGMLYFLLQVLHGVSLDVV